MNVNTIYNIVQPLTVNGGRIWGTITYNDKINMWIVSLESACDELVKYYNNILENENSRKIYNFYFNEVPPICEGYEYNIKTHLW